MKIKLQVFCFSLLFMTNLHATTLSLSGMGEPAYTVPDIENDILNFPAAGAGLAKPSLGTGYSRSFFNDKITETLSYDYPAGTVLGYTRPEPYERNHTLAKSAWNFPAIFYFPYRNLFLIAGYGKSGSSLIEKEERRITGRWEQQSGFNYILNRDYRSDTENSENTDSESDEKFLATGYRFDKFDLALKIRSDETSARIQNNSVFSASGGESGSSRFITGNDSSRAEYLLSLHRETGVNDIFLSYSFLSAQAGNKLVESSINGAAGPLYSRRAQSSGNRALLLDRIKLGDSFLFSLALKLESRIEKEQTFETGETGLEFISGALYRAEPVRIYAETGYGFDKTSRDTFNSSRLRTGTVDSALDSFSFRLGLEAHILPKIFFRLGAFAALNLRTDTSVFFDPAAKNVSFLYRSDTETRRSFFTAGIGYALSERFNLDYALRITSDLSEARHTLEIRISQPGNP